MKNIKTYLITLSISILVTSVACSEENTITWKQAVQEALRQHPDLISARAQIDGARADKGIARSNALPQVSASLNRGVSKTSSSKAKNSYRYGIDGEQLIFDGGKTLFNIEAAGKNLNAAESYYKQLSASVRSELKVSFIGVLTAQELLKITQEIEQRRKRNVDLIQLRYDAGREHRGSLLTEQANWEQSKFEVKQAERNLVLVQRRLCKALGREEFSPLTVMGDLNEIAAAQSKPVLENIADTTPGVIRSKFLEQRARFQLNAARAGFLPAISVNAGAGKSGDSWAPQDNEWSAGAKVSVPLFEGGRQQGEAAKAKALLVQAEAEYRSTRDSQLFSLEEKWKNKEDGQGNVVVRQKFLEAAIERSKIAEAQYSNGLLGFDNWTIIENDLVQAKKAFLNAQEQALAADADWIDVQGGALENESH